MDIFNRPPTIAEDTLQYTIYPPPDFSDKSSATALATCIQALVDTLLPRFLWHRDSFELKPISNSDEGGWVLEGRMRVGDCIDDEWCVVWLLKQISAQWDVVIGVFDSDGQFLLIEAAEALPAWIKPMNSENRVWIYNSQLHLIPIPHTSPPSKRVRRRKLPGTQGSGDEGDAYDNDTEEFLAVDDAIRLVRNRSVDTTAPREVENIVWERISGYPTAARNHLHTTKAYIPGDISRVLSVNPSLVQKAVETFYTRDAIQLRAAHRMLRFPPSTSSLNFVTMTRTAYAQLAGQKFFPPKVFGTWQELEGSKERRWRDTGMKIAVGFEILFQESKSRTDVSIAGASQSSAEANKEALSRDTEYIEYIQKLDSVSYFKGEVEGSERWKELETRAAISFVDARRTDNGAGRQSFAARVASALSSVRHVPGITPPDDEDSEEWLSVDSQAFDAMLENTVGAKSVSQSKSISTAAMDIDEPAEGLTEEDRIASEQAARLKVLASQVAEFVEGEGDMEGAKFADEDLSESEEEDDMMSDPESEAEAEEDAKEDRRAAMDKLVPALNPADYGKMPPSFHSNSQRTARETIGTDRVEANKSNGNQGPETAAPSKPTRQPILTRDKYDGVDSDDETDDEDEGDSEEEDDQPQIVGDIEIDMGEEEGEFLEFSRQALGITDAHWKDILQERRGRGAFVPASVRPESLSFAPAPGVSGPSAPLPPPDNPTIHGKTDSIVHPDLNSFEAVMKALDEELARSRKVKTKSNSQVNGSGVDTEELPDPSEDPDIVSAMEAELRDLLEKGDEDIDETGDDEPLDYNLIKNFLESFKSQGGLSGPVSNLAGRLQPGWTLPRDQ